MCGVPGRFEQVNSLTALSSCFSACPNSRFIRFRKSTLTCSVTSGKIVKNTGFGVRHTWIQISALPPTQCMKEVNHLSLPRCFLICKMGQWCWIPLRGQKVWGKDMMHIGQVIRVWDIVFSKLQLLCCTVHLPSSPAHSRYSQEENELSGGEKTLGKCMW